MLEKRRIALIAAATNVQVGGCALRVIYHAACSGDDYKARGHACQARESHPAIQACANPAPTVAATEHPIPQIQVARWLGERLARPCGAKYLTGDADVALPTEMQSPTLSERCAWEGLSQIMLVAAAQLLTLPACTLM